MKWVTRIARVLMGLGFTGASIAYFVTPTPEMPPGPMSDFFSGMVATRYFFTLLKVTEVICGLLLISGFFVPLALVVLAPIILNIFMVHAFLEPSGLPLALILGVLEIYLAFFSREYSPTIKQLFRAKSPQ